MERNEPAAPAADDGSGIPADMVVDDDATTTASAPDPAAEAEQGFARRLGWMPKEEFSGPAERWVDHKAFIEKTQSSRALLQSQLKRMVERDAQKDRLLKEQGDALKELLDRSRGAEARGFEYAREQVKARQREAVKNADEQAYEQAERELAELDRMKPAAREALKKPDESNSNTRTAAPADPAVTAWVDQNKWFSADKKLNKIAIGLEADLMEDEPYLSTSERLAKVTDEVKRRFPEKFANAARDNPPAAARPGPQGARPAVKKAKTEADLPPSARATMDRLVRQGVLTKKQYLDDYKW